MEDRDWSLLLKRVNRGECVPFLGPGICSQFMLPYQQIAFAWAGEHGFPFPDREDLARVSQYLAVERYDLFPHDQLQSLFQETDMPDFDAPGQPHAILASLPLPIYITTNYYNVMYQALKAAHKEPTLEFARWKELLALRHPSPLEAGFEPTPATPLVYHLLGYYESPESLVVTEDDYIDFLVNIAGRAFPLPPRIEQSLSESSLLLIGYNPADWDFRILFRGLIATTRPELRRLSVTVQLPPLAEEMDPAQRERMERYLDAYMRTKDTTMHVYWGSATDFLQELEGRLRGEREARERAEAAAEPVNQVRLFRLINECFDKEDLLTLAFELEVDADNLPPAKHSFVRQLIIELKKRGRLDELLSLCRHKRPAVSW